VVVKGLCWSPEDCVHVLDWLLTCAHVLIAGFEFFFHFKHEDN
jgi:hypothetical protein